MAALKGFWSYVHADDEAELGRITQLGKDIVAQYMMATGDEIDLFLDREQIEWGNEWRAQLDAALASTAFFIPVLTPRYFLSAECRRELQAFARRVKELELHELLLPILYVDVPALGDDAPDDDLIELVRQLQWVDWTVLRFEDATSGAYRKRVGELADRLVRANRDAEIARHHEGAGPVEGTPVAEEDEPGTIELLAGAEAAFPALKVTLEAISSEIEKVSAIMTDGTNDVRVSDMANKGFGGRMFVARQVARRLEEPAEKIADLANRFTSDVHDLNQGLRYLIPEIGAAVQRNELDRDDACVFLVALRHLCTSTEEGMQGATEMIHVGRSIEGLSRDLRRPVRRLREGLTELVESSKVTAEWVQLADGLNMDCPSMTVDDLNEFLAPRKDDRAGEGLP